jgi:hypothetical protein
MSSIENQVHDTDKRLSVHEAICAQRYESIQEAFAKGIQRMRKIEYLLYAALVSIFLGPSFIVDVVKSHFLK